MLIWICIWISDKGLSMEGSVVAQNLEVSGNRSGMHSPRMSIDETRPGRSFDEDDSLQETWPGVTTVLPRSRTVIPGPGPDSEEQLRTICTPKFGHPPSPPQIPFPDFAESLSVGTYNLRSRK